MRIINKLLAISVLSTLIFQGCASYPPRQPTRYPPSQPMPSTPSQPAQSVPQPEAKPLMHAPGQTSTIAADFSRKADDQVHQGRLDLAAATLERGLRVAPKDATLWSQLAEVKLQQQQYQQAQSLAAKSNSLAGGNMAIMRKNQQIIDKSRQETGSQ